MSRSVAAGSSLSLSSYLDQRQRWPATGRHILAQYDDASVIVYQAYRPEIGHFAVEHQYFGGAFSLARMSWIKPNFLWMMYRSGWASKDGQEVVLAVRLRRAAFDEILAGAVHASYLASVYGDRAAWQRAVATSDVRLQWDPDHAPGGARQERRAIQLGLRGDVLRAYSRDWILAIEDVSDLARAEHRKVAAGDLAALVTPTEAVYPVADGSVAARLELSPWPPS